jgi:hypothetical protein
MSSCSSHMAPWVLGRWMGVQAFPARYDLLSRILKDPLHSRDMVDPTEPEFDKLA